MDSFDLLAVGGPLSGRVFRITPGQKLLSPETMEVYEIFQIEVQGHGGCNLMVLAPSWYNTEPNKARKLLDLLMVTAAAQRLKNKPCYSLMTIDEAVRRICADPVGEGWDIPPTFDGVLAQAMEGVEVEILGEYDVFEV